jgi:hypothetical protein
MSHCPANPKVNKRVDLASDLPVGTRGQPNEYQGRTQADWGQILMQASTEVDLRSLPGVIQGLAFPNANCYLG